MNMKNEELISVVVPIYNTEKYLRECLDSIVNQTYKNLEILLINDGSTDSSLDICKEYEEKDNRIKIISQENQGLSGARNTGIDNSSADLLMFIDSDDVMLDTMIEELYNNLIEYDADISYCDFFYYYMDKENDFTQEENTTITTYSDQDKINLLFHDGYIPVQWNKLFKREIFDDIRYPLGKIHEDEYVIHRQFYNAKKLVKTNRKLYKYRKHKDSIMSSDNPKKKYDAYLGFIDRFYFFHQKHQFYNALNVIYRILHFLRIREGNEKDEYDKITIKHFNSIKRKYFYYFIVIKFYRIKTRLLSLIKRR